MRSREPPRTWNSRRVDTAHLYTTSLLLCHINFISQFLKAKVVNSFYFCECLKIDVIKQESFEFRCRQPKQSSASQGLSWVPRFSSRYVVSTHRDYFANFRISNKVKTFAINVECCCSRSSYSFVFLGNVICLCWTVYRSGRCFHDCTLNF